MSDTMELAKRAVACKGWRWQSGMAEVRRGRVMDVVEHESETLARALVRDRSSAYMNGSVNLMWLVCYALCTEAPLSRLLCTVLNSTSL